MVGFTRRVPLVTVTIGQRSRTGVPLDLTAGLVLVMVGLCVSTVVLAYPATPGGQVGSLWLSVGGAVGVGCGSFVLARRRIGMLGTPRWPRMGPLFSACYALVFGVFSLGWLAPQTGAATVVAPAQVPPAVALATIGLACWVAGYLLGAPGGVRRAGRSLVDRMFSGTDWMFRFPSVPIVVYLVGVVARLYQLRTSQFGYLQNGGSALTSPSAFGQVTSLLADFAQFGLILAALDAFIVSRSFRSRIVLVVMLFAEVANGLFAGSKGSVIVSLASAGIVAVFAYDRLSRRAVVTGVIVVLIVFPSTAAYRYSIRNSTTQSVSTGLAARSLVQTLKTTISGLTPRGLFVDSPAAVASRLREVDNVAIIRQKSPSVIPYQPWTDLVVAPMIDWVPRLVWPSKPVLSTGEEFSVEYYGLPPTLITASAITVPGDLLKHGGIVPLGVGMLLLGVLMHTLDMVIDPSRDLRRLLLFIPLLTLMIPSESDTTTLLLGVVGMFVAVAVAGWLAFIPRR